MPGSMTAGMESAYSEKHLHLLQREQLAAQATLTCHRGNVIATLICVARLKAIDYCAAERCVAFDSSHNVLLKADHMRDRELIEEVRLFAGDVLVDPFAVEVEATLCDLRKSVRENRMPHLMTGLRSKPLYGAFFRDFRQACHFECDAIGFRWLMATIVDVKRRRAQRPHRYLLKDVLFLFGHEEAEAIKKEEARGNKRLDAESEKMLNKFADQFVS